MSDIVTIKHLKKYFGTEKAVDDISFEVKPGEIFAFLGSNGSGKTTTLRCLLNIYRPDEGEVKLFGQTYDNTLASQIGYLPEERGLYTKAKLNDVFLYFTTLRGFDVKTSQKLIDEYLTKVDLMPHKNKIISQLSSGMQQKIQIGIAIIHKPKLLILDEPFKGLDPVNREMFINIFSDMRREGTSILYSTHVLDEAQKLSNRLIIIKKGKTKAYGTVQEIRNMFGHNTIQIESERQLPENKSLYTLSSVGNNYTLMLNNAVESSEVLNYILEKNIKFNSFKIDAPSLNQIFIELNKDNE